MSAFQATTPDHISRREFVGAAFAAPLAAGAAMAAKEHVVVVGAGAFGGWSALALLRAGMRVTLVDAWGAGHGRASSGGETRVIRGVYNGVLAYSQMAARALVLWRAAERQWQRQVLFRTGTLWLCAGDDGYVQRSGEPMRQAGLPLESLSLDDAARRFPQCGMDGVRTAWWEAEAGFLAARVACELVRETFVREGGSYRQAWVRPGTAGSVSEGGRLTRLALVDGSTRGGSVTMLDADRFVFACGPWMGQLFPDVVGRRIVATRQEVFFFGTPPADARFTAPALPTWVHLGDRLVYGIPDHERRGVKIADDTAGPEVDPTTLDRTPSPAGIANARVILRERFPALADAALLEARVCQYETSSDGHFLVDRHPHFENAWLVGGGSGHGYKMGPALGEHVAALVQGRAEVHPLFAYGRLQPRA